MKRTLSFAIALCAALLLALDVVSASAAADLERRGGVTRDCNQNGVDDALDIAGGASSDDDNDGVPDECALSYGG